MKKNFSLKFMAMAMVAALTIAPGCKDYDDDINGLKQQVGDLKTQVDAIDKLIKSGSVITNVENVDGGFKITLSNNKSYVINHGKDGKDGKDGKSSIVTIKDGFWHINGESTGLAAQGPKGDKGDKGDKGVDGTHGSYYVPNHKTGNFDLIEFNPDGTKKEPKDSGIKFLPEGTVTAVYANGVVTFFNVKDAPEEGIKIGSITLTSLVVIPDYVSVGGALPVLNFSPLRTKDCGDIVPQVLVRYRVSPSNATVDQIDIDNLVFDYNDPSVRVENDDDVEARAVFESLEDGVLTVRASVNTAALWSNKANPDKRIDEIALRVPMKQSGALVSSDWSSIAFKEMFPGISINGKLPVENELPKTVDEAKALTLDPKAVAVVEMAYDETLNLAKYAHAMFRFNDTHAGDFDGKLQDKYGVSFEFDLKDDKNKLIEYKLGANNTDQQQFIQINGTNATTRVYSIAGPSPAAEDRTPIVHVKMMTKGCAEPIAHGYIKISIVPKKVEPVVINKAYVGKTIVPGCEPSVDAFRIGTKMMNEEFYAEVGMSKTDFHEKFNLEDGEGVGEVTEVKDPEAPHSFNLVYTLTKDEVVNNIGKTLVKKAAYKYVKAKEADITINIQFTVKIEREVVNLANTLDNYWFKDATGKFTHITHNVAVPNKGDEDSNHATFKTLINNAFKTVKTTNVLDLPAEVQSYPYEYKFVPTAQQPLQTVMIGGQSYTITVAPDGKKLQASVAGAVATDVVVIEKVGELEYLTYQDNDVAKALLNEAPEFMKARLALHMKNTCDIDVKVVIRNLKDENTFDVHFLRPVNADSNEEAKFVDGVDFGAEGSFIDLKKIAVLSDWRNYAKDTKDYNFLPNHPNYYKYYGVTEIDVDVDGIVCEGLFVSGEALTKLPTTLVVAETANADVFDGVTYEYGRFTYKNNGASIDKAFTMIVPIKVTYKWGVVSTKVRVLVDKTSAPKP